MLIPTKACLLLLLSVAVAVQSLFAAHSKEQCDARFQKDYIEKILGKEVECPSNLRGGICFQKNATLIALRLDSSGRIESIFINDLCAGIFGLRKLVDELVPKSKRGEILPQPSNPKPETSLVLRSGCRMTQREDYECLTMEYSEFMCQGCAPATVNIVWKDLQSTRPLALSHAWIVVPTGAPQSKLLEKAGFRIAPTINRHDGQGTASVSVEFLNGFFELIYPDPTVPVSAASKAGAEKFRLKSEWRDSGYSPIGIVFDRTEATPEKFSFSTWRITVDWLEKDTFIEMLTPKEMPKTLSLSISSHAQNPESENEKLSRDPVKGAMFHHPNGARRLTAVRVVAPNAESLPPSAAYIASHGLMKFDVGDRWLLELTLDNGKQRMMKNFQPDLPLIIRY
jgi:Glyoxalase-like domain